MQKRFIAGAMCPACKSLDKICLEKLPTEHRVECVSCGYTDTRLLTPMTDNLNGTPK
ncbi:MAG: YheV family putative metal-binding protein [Gammaproteobacteria bacterium]|nr:YheV family putative metal-binding protein [Gammaproteobacteria bacterium]